MDTIKDKEKKNGGHSFAATEDICGVNPVTGLDYPDPDVIRVGDTYYLISTTMHFLPGGEILRSYDLAHWEHVSYVFDRLDSTERERLLYGEGVYGQGMWAASLRFHKGKFYVCFVANNTGKTYLFTSETVEGPWEKRTIAGFYHDCSLLFDTDDRVYLAYGGGEIRITELSEDLSGPKPGGLNRVAVRDTGRRPLGFEGTHFYKINGKYYLFLIHSLENRWMRTEACYRADTLDGTFTGGDVLSDDMGYLGQGVAQGGIVDTPDGRWYAVLFQDSGAVGRLPVVVPVLWDGDWPLFGKGGKVERMFSSPSTRPSYQYRPLVESDDFSLGLDGRNGGEDPLSVADRKRLYGTFGLKSAWQFNHEPELSLVRVDPCQKEWMVETDRRCGTLTEAKNILTQRMRYPSAAAEVTVDGAGLSEGDYAGLCALQGQWAFAAIAKRGGKTDLVMRSAPEEKGGDERELAVFPWKGTEQPDVVRFRLEADFAGGRDIARFFYWDGAAFCAIGPEHKLYFRLDHFTGCRFGLFVYSTKTWGGRAVFRDFRYF